MSFFWIGFPRGSQPSTPFARQAPAVFNVASLVYLSCPLMELAAAAWGKKSEMGCGVVGWALNMAMEHSNLDGEDMGYPSING